MQITAQQVAQLIGGTVEGDESIVIHGPAKIEEGKPGTLTFLANPKYESYLYTTQASVVLVASDFVPQQNVQPTLIRVTDVYGAITKLLEQFGQQQEEHNRTVSPLAFVHEDVRLETGVGVGAFSVVEKGVSVGAGTRIDAQVYVGAGVEIGANVTIYPGVKIYRGCKIADHCIIHSNAVIGSDGFGFAPQEDGTYKKVPQLGNVILEESVEIGANAVVDRATMGSTVIRKGAKIDNLVQIAHNVDVGSNTVIAAQAGIAGSTKIGQNVQIGGQAGFVGHIKVADGVRVQAQSGVARNVKKEGTALYGSPALGYNEYLKAYSVFKNLPAIYRQLNELQKRVQELESDQK
ncbi:MAG: UDP-3-O-(3-hydroxymyristoyl)glucosamine N-acyltransferase [Bacteroidota bacterium]